MQQDNTEKLAIEYIDNTKDSAQVQTHQQMVL
jgi:hypothetical protein